MSSRPTSEPAHGLKAGFRRRVMASDESSNDAALAGARESVNLV